MPVKDGRKIVLVLYGEQWQVFVGQVSDCSNELGLDNAFDEIYASSAGFCNASYLLSGNGKEGTSIYYEELVGHKFLDFWKVWDIANIDYVIECTKKIKPLNVKNILAHPTKLFVQLDDITKNKIEFL